MAAGARKINIGILFTNGKLPSIHSVSAPSSRSKAIASTYVEKKIFVNINLEAFFSNISYNRKMHVVISSVFCMHIMKYSLIGCMMLTHFTTLSQLYRGGKCAYHDFLEFLEPVLCTIFFPSHCFPT